MTNLYQLKWRAILSIMAIILLIWAALVGFIYFQGKKDLNLAIENRIATARSIATTLEKGLYSQYIKRIQSLVDTSISPARMKMVRAFSQRDRELLLQLSNPFLKGLRRESDNLVSFTWILPDNKVLLRTHRPDLTGDDISTMRPDIAAANQSLDPVSGYAVSGVGLNFSVLEPVFCEGNYSGLVQWGLSSTQLLNLLQEKIAGPTAILIDKDKTGYIKPERLKGTLLTVDGTELITNSPASFEAESKKIDWQADRSWLHQQGSHRVLVRLLPLPGFDGQPVGHIVSLLDLTEQYSTTMNRFWSVLGGSTGLLLVLFLLLYKNFNRLLGEIFGLNRSLEEQNRSLEQRVAERSAELKASRDEWIAMFNAIPDMVNILDQELRILETNTATCEFFQLPREEIIGKHCYELFHNSDKICAHCPEIDKIIKNYSYIDVVTHKNLRKTFQVTAAPITFQDRQTQTSVHITRDITDKLKLEEDLMHAQKMEEIGTLAGGVAHDFNNILSAIIGYSTLAKTKASGNERLEKDLDNILTAGQRATDLVKQILTFSRKRGADAELFQPHLLVKETIKMLRSSLPATIKVVDEIDDNSGWISASQTRIHQLVMNLCTNAVQAMEDNKGTLTVSLTARQLDDEEPKSEEKQHRNFIHLSVADDGCGMDTETRERIFEPYFTTKAGDKGTGLGLSVVHGIVEEMQGFIRVNSIPGEGSRFDVYLPAVEPQQDKAEDISSESLPQGNERILIVDDEAAIIEIAESLLEDLGYQIETEQSSTKALEKIRQNPSNFDLLITDQTMPELTGLELAQHATELNPKLPVIICTGYSAVLNKQTKLPAYVHELLAKPVNLKQLATTIREVLDQPNR